MSYRARVIKRDGEWRVWTAITGQIAGFPTWASAYDFARWLVKR